MCVDRGSRGRGVGDGVVMSLEIMHFLYVSYTSVNRAIHALRYLRAAQLHRLHAGYGSWKGILTLAKAVASK